MANRSPMPRLGLCVFAGAAIFLGVLGLISANFATNWQRVPPGVPGRTGLAYLAAACELLGSIAILVHRFARPGRDPHRHAFVGVGGAALLTVLYAIFTALWVTQALKAPRIYDSWGNVFEEFSLVAAGLAATASLGPPGSPMADKAVLFARIYGVCCISFAVDHVVYWRQAATWVPAWLPPGQVFWIFATATCFLLAAIAILTGIQAGLAATLLTAEIFGFEIFVWIPRLVAAPHQHFNWSGNAINLALMSAAWVVADTFRAARPAVPSGSATAS